MTSNSGFGFWSPNVSNSIVRLLAFICGIGGSPLGGVRRAAIAGDGFSDDVSTCTGAKKNGESGDIFWRPYAPSWVALGDSAPVDICVATSTNTGAQHPSGERARCDSVADDVFFGQVQGKAARQVMYSCFR